MGSISPPPGTSSSSGSSSLSRGLDSMATEIDGQETFIEAAMKEALYTSPHLVESDGSNITSRSSPSQVLASVASTSSDLEPQGPFEGPEKLLELWFADSPELLPEEALRASFTILQDPDGNPLPVQDGDRRTDRVGLRAVPRRLWEEMLDLVKCKVLSVVEGHDVDAYLLSESSMFVFPHKIILKTCGTTTLLLGLRQLLELARCSLTGKSDFDIPDSFSPTIDEACRSLGSMVRQCFYSRKSFMFPERQKGPHKDWILEVKLLDAFFVDGSAYTVGKMNGDHWLLFMCCPGDEERNASPSTSGQMVDRPLRLPSPSAHDLANDQTLEILMTHLSSRSCSAFEFPADMHLPPPPEHVKEPLDRGHLLGIDLSAKLGLSSLFPGTQLDAFAFEPCGYSANAVIPASSQSTSGYWTIHVTPEQGSSYASFESNIALHRVSGEVGTPLSDPSRTDAALAPHDLPSLIQQVVDIFQPGKMSITLFTSSRRREETGKAAEDDASLLHSLRLPGYTRKDRIAYEFESYDLVFCHFETVGEQP